MDCQGKQCASSTLEAVEAAELTQVSGGIWDYSNRMGYLGQILEDQKNRPYGDVFGAKNLDQAAAKALQGWVSIP